MAQEIHTISIIESGAMPARQDRLLTGLFEDVPFPASAAALTVLGSITAGTGFSSLPSLAPSGGTLTAGVSPADPAVAVATGLKCVTATVATPGAGVAINDTFNLAGGSVAAAGPYGNGTLSAGAATLLTATHIKVVSVTVNAGGTGGTPGAVTITGTSGTGTKFQATGTISAGGVLTGPLTVTVAGDYTAGMSDISAEPVTGGSLSGATVTVVMGALTLGITTAGSYTEAPATTNTPTNGTGSGTGVTVTAAFGLASAIILHSGNYSSAPGFAVTGGGGSGASIATGTLGGNGNAIPRQVVGNQPAAYQVTAQMIGQGGTIHTVAKRSTDFTVALVPPSTTLSAGTFDALSVG